MFLLLCYVMELCTKLTNGFQVIKVSFIVKFETLYDQHPFLLTVLPSLYSE